LVKKSLTDKEGRCDIYNKERKLIYAALLNYLLWILRRNEDDLINIYNYLTPLVRLANGGYTLNRGYWDEKTTDPLQAQQNLCKVMGKFACLDSAKTVLDVGSGFSGPAITLKSLYSLLDIVCIDLNFNQLRNAAKVRQAQDEPAAPNVQQNDRTLAFINATATTLPVARHSFDRIVALEAHHHFRPLSLFIKESKRVLVDNGLLIIASPVKTFDTNIMSEFIKIGIPFLTLNSKNLVLSNLKSMIQNCGFQINDIVSIGASVFPAQTDYYNRNRELIKQKLPKMYPSYTEKLLHNLMTKTNQAYQKGKIDYVLIKCSPA